MAETFYVENFGCRATQADGAAIERQLMQRGLAPAENRDQASVVVLNTCTVTAEADKDARAAIRRVHRENPESKILVTGCYAQRAPQEVAELAGVTWVVGNSHKSRVADVSLRREISFRIRSLTSASDSIFVSDIFAHTELLAAPVFEAGMHSEKTRPNLKVQDGCNNRCSFCIIPFTRGPEPIARFERSGARGQRLVAAGYKEVVISRYQSRAVGVEISQSRIRFEDLVRAILDRTRLEKLRISSVEPMDWSDDLIELGRFIAAHREARARAAAIGKRYDLATHAPQVSPVALRRAHPKIRAAMPDAAIGADVMVGFPGETDELFEESRAFIESLPFTYLHVFTYSARPGTPAAGMPDQVPVHVARERNRVLRELAAEKNLDDSGGPSSGRQSRRLRCIVQARATPKRSQTTFLKLHLEGKHEANHWVRRTTWRTLSADGLVGTGRQPLY